MARTPPTPSGDAPDDPKLDVQQTKLHHPQQVERATPYLYQPLSEVNHNDDAYENGPPPAEPVEIAFRHRGWVEDRERVRKALMAVNAPRNRLDRFNSCGSDCVIMGSPDGESLAVVANYCGDRWCVPCMHARANVVQRYFHDLILGHEASFDTLTLVRDDKPLQVRLNRLLGSFRKLRRCKEYKCYVKSGVFVVQVTRGSGKDHWHVHLHVLRLGRPFPRHVLSDLWKKCTGDSFIVDSRRVVDAAKDAGYIARYAARGVDRDVLLDHQALVEAVVALRGRRMFATFGGWRGITLEKQRQDLTGWRRVGKLVEVYAAARCGEIWATGILRRLKVVISRKSESPKFFPIHERPDKTIEQPRAPDGP